MQLNKAQSFVTIIIIIAAFALILRIAIEQVVNMNIAQNESNAQANIKLVSAALENYAKDNQGFYPANFTSLLQTKPPYLDINYVNQSPLKGYVYACLRLESSGYSCQASPVKCNISGRKKYIVSTGGSLLSEECSVKE